MAMGNIPIFGSQYRGMLATAGRRLVAMILLASAAAGLLFLAHIARPESTHRADDREEQCKIIEEEGEEYPGELASCQTDLSYLRAVERSR